MSLINQNNKVQSKIGTRSFRENTDFTKIGGLGNHLKTLRDIIILPLIHGNVFQYFNIRSPKGVLFYGPPGTGKTLVAGALATELNREGVGKVNFFLRKGADVLDKWVGESEKKLRDLFDKATKNRPSIIFFDEIDGLAPTRSKKNDHIHSSIVATLLALMDGLDNKPGVVVIGATNRIDSIDPALRRPGRFDKELYFPLPTLEARKEIIQVHTATWRNAPTQEFLTHIAQATAGFCGSDLAALCTEAVLCCLKRVYPNIENLGNRIKIELESLKVEECDFMDARQNLLPSSLKLGSKMRCLNPIIKPLLQRQLENVIKNIKLLWPHFSNENFRYIVGEERYAGRVLLLGSNHDGLNTHLIPAILQAFEHLPYQILDLPSLIDKNLTVQLHFPSMIILSRVDEWWSYLEESDQLAFIASLEEIHSGLPILILATCKRDMPVMLHEFFYNNSSIVLRIGQPSVEENEKFFTPLFFDTKVLSLCTILEDKLGLTKAVPRFEHVGPRRGRPFRYKTRLYKEKCQAVKRKREINDNELVVNKRIKLCENMFCTLTHSVANLPRTEVDRAIKKEQLFFCNERPRSYVYRKSRDHFTILLTDLLYQRSKDPEQITSPEAMEPPIEPLVPIKIEPFSDSMSTIVEVPENQDPRMKTIFTLWKRVSRITSMNMTISEMELLYDIISACINMYKHSFDKLIEKLEEILSRIENN